MDAKTIPVIEHGRNTLDKWGESNLKNRLLMII